MGLAIRVRNKLLLFGLLIVGCFTTSLWWYYHPRIVNNTITQVVVQKETVEVPVETIKEVMVSVVKEVPVIEIKEVPVEVVKTITNEVEVVKLQQLQNFSSLEELTKWVNQYNAPVVIVADSDGTVRFNNRCGLVAQQMQAQAMKEGYLVNVEIIGSTEYQKWYGEPLPYNVTHAVLSAIIGNEVYYIEPSTKKIWLANILN